LTETVADEERPYFNDELRGHAKLAVFFDLRGELGHEIYQAVVCRRFRNLRSASVIAFTARGHGNTQCARRRSRVAHLRGGSDRQTAMQKYLSCAISRLPVLEANTILRVSGHLPGLHPLHLCWSSWSTVLARVSVVIDREGRPRLSLVLTR
jgi:hypothetical protein